METSPRSLNWKNVKNDFEILVDKYEYLLDNEKNIDEDSPIWVMWYQGIEKAPSMIKSCIQSIILNKGKHPLYLISKYNLEKYIKLPKYIIEKLNKRLFSITHFSDIVRFALLYKYGGYWIDSTYFVNTPIRKINVSYYTLKLNSCFKRSHPFIKCLWAGNFMAVSKKSFIATYGYAALLYYWKKYNSLINYFIVDFIIYTAYANAPKFKSFITNLPFVTCDISLLQKRLNLDYKKPDFDCFFNKLSRKKKYHSFNGKNITNYGFLIEKYKLNYKYIDNIDNN